MKRKSQFSCFVPWSLIFFRFENQTIKEFICEGGKPHLRYRKVSGSIGSMTLRWRSRWLHTDWQLYRPIWRGGNSAALESTPAPARGLSGMVLGLLTVLEKFLWYGITLRSVLCCVCSGALYSTRHRVGT